MFEWLCEIEKPFLPTNNENGELKIKRIELHNGLLNMSEVCQLFACFDMLLNEQALTSFPTPNEKAIRIILNEIVPHYEDVK
ncbi:hypothetical protein [Neobacillus terrae]|uniref:hypothetical protein n=1 Tax=Neobacillus terrae TaxID=3034837 RepID=UPI001408E147|nr:hypothetical protein [Neobacillus terrae]NHM33825.1 hypothetical protein [Neobacillus terrae]